MKFTEGNSFRIISPQPSPDALSTTITSNLMFVVFAETLDRHFRSNAAEFQLTMMMERSRPEAMGGISSTLSEIAGAKAQRKSAGRCGGGSSAGRLRGLARAVECSSG